MGGHCWEMVKARLHHGDLLRQDRPELQGGVRAPKPHRVGEMMKPNTVVTDDHVPGLTKKNEGNIPGIPRWSYYLQPNLSCSVCLVFFSTSITFPVSIFGSLTNSPHQKYLKHSQTIQYLNQSQPMICLLNSTQFTSPQWIHRHLDHQWDVCGQAGHACGSGQQHEVLGRRGA